MAAISMHQRNEFIIKSFRSTVLDNGAECHAMSFATLFL